MIVHVPGLLSAEQLQAARALLATAPWSDGRATAGHQSARVKENLQLQEDCAAAKELRNLVLGALERSPLFISATLPARVFPPLFNRYEAGMNFGAHIDNAIRQVPNTASRIRSDISATLHLSAPDEYDGGELIVEDTYGTHTAKLAAGDMILYPATSLHHVTPVTRGARVAAFFWVQSMVRDDSARSILFDLDRSVVDLTRAAPDNPTIVRLTGCYHNLIRRWADP